jgi:hypothetical protein
VKLVYPIQVRDLAEWIDTRHGFTCTGMSSRQWLSVAGPFCFLTPCASVRSNLMTMGQRVADSISALLASPATVSIDGDAVSIRVVMDTVMEARLRRKVYRHLTRGDG